ncbi:MAG: hypothetical protein R3B93_09890 [Bacteroidia bacterium]
MLLVKPLQVPTKKQANQETEDELRLMNLAKPMREKLDIEQLMKEQNYKHPTKEELDNIIKEANIKEPIEELLKMI